MLWYFLVWSIFLFFAFCCPFFSVRGLCPPERGNHIFVYPADSCGQDLGPLWRAVSKRWGLSERTHWFCVQGRPIRVKNYMYICGFKKISDSCGCDTVTLSQDTVDQISRGNFTYPVSRQFVFDLLCLQYMTNRPGLWLYNIRKVHVERHQQTNSK